VSDWIFISDYQSTAQDSRGPEHGTQFYGVGAVVDDAVVDVAAMRADGAAMLRSTPEIVAAVAAYLGRPNASKLSDGEVGQYLLAQGVFALGWPQGTDAADAGVPVGGIWINSTTGVISVRLS